MRRRPEIASIAHIGTGAVLAERLDQRRDKPLPGPVMDLRQTHDRSTDTLRDQRQRCLFGHAREREIQRNHILFGRHLTRKGQSRQTARGKKRLVGAGKRGPDCLDGATIRFATRREIRPVMDKGQMNDGVRR